VTAGRTPVLLLTLLALTACEPPTPRAKVQKPFPDVEEATAAAEPTPEVRGDRPATRDSLVASVPASVEEIEARHRALVARLAEVELAIIALEEELKLATEPDHHAQLQDRADELRASARALAAEARDLRVAADELRDTSTLLKALGGADTEP